MGGAAAEPSELAAVPPAVRIRARGSGAAGVAAAVVVGLLLDLDPLCVDDVPLAAEEVEVLALRLTGLLVEEEPVERMAVVGDLQLPVLALRSAEQRRLHAGACGR